MLKLLMSLSLFASFAVADSLSEFLLTRYLKNEKISVRSIKKVKILELKNGFKAHFFNIKLQFLPLQKEINKSEILFVKDDIFTTDIINLKTKTSMRDELLGQKISITYERLKDENTENCH